MNRYELLQRMQALPFALEDYWLVAGGAMVLHGIRSVTNDIDLGCTRSLADQLEAAGCPTVRMSDGTRKLCYAPDIEIFEEWLYDRVVIVDGIPTISLPGLIQMKQELGREKDLRDIRLIEKYLSVHETQEEVK
ncbi:MAG: hypothetical protein J6K13_02010 [Clostridia bacterium]|nr:hypothetical protein [Clostridia bacterium]